MISNGMPLHVRGEGVAPAVCYDLCNNAYTEAQSTGKTPALCESNSRFMTSFTSCHRCLDSNGSMTSEPVSPTPTSTNASENGNGNGSIPAAPEGFVRFQQFVDYCNALNGHPAPPTVTQTTGTVEQASVVSTSYYTTITTTAWVASTLSGSNSTTSAMVTVTIPIEELPAWNGASDAASQLRTSTTISSSASSTMTDSSPKTETSSSASSVESGTGSSVLVVGISIAAAISIVILGGLFVFFYHRKKKQKQRDLPESPISEQVDRETKAQLHGDSLIRPAELETGSVQSPVVEMEGDEKAGCFELDSTMLRAELETCTMTTTTMTTQPA